MDKTLLRTFCDIYRQKVRFISYGVHDGPAVHAVVVAGVSVMSGIQAGFGRHHRAAVAAVLHHRLRFVVLRLGHEVVDGERVAEGRVGVVVVWFQVRGLMQQQRGMRMRMRMMGKQVLGVRER